MERLLLHFSICTMLALLGASNVHADALDDDFNRVKAQQCPSQRYADPNIQCWGKCHGLQGDAFAECNRNSDACQTQYNETLNKIMQVNQAMDACKSKSSPDEEQTNHHSGSTGSGSDSGSDDLAQRLAQQRQKVSSETPAQRYENAEQKLTRYQEQYKAQELRAQQEADAHAQEMERDAERAAQEARDRQAEIDRENAQRDMARAQNTECKQYAGTCYSQCTHEIWRWTDGNWPPGFLARCNSECLPRQINGQHCFTRWW